MMDEIDILVEVPTEDGTVLLGPVALSKFIAVANGERGLVVRPEDIADAPGFSPSKINAARGYGRGADTVEELPEHDTALQIRCTVCEADPGEHCYFRPSSGIPNGEGYKHAIRGLTQRGLSACQERKFGWLTRSNN